nr:zinc finger BED domain-containing protein RICESLEEPER 2-like [Ipomoea batatas]
MSTVRSMHANESHETVEKEAEIAPSVGMECNDGENKNKKRKTSRQRSEVWDHFTKRMYSIDQASVLCSKLREVSSQLFNEYNGLLKVSQGEGSNFSQSLSVINEDCDDQPHNVLNIETDFQNINMSLALKIGKALGSSKFGLALIGSSKYWFRLRKQQVKYGPESCLHIHGKGFTINALHFDMGVSINCPKCKPRRSPKGATLVGSGLPAKAHFAALLTPLRARPNEILAYAEECQLVKPTDQGYVAVPDQGKYYRYHRRYGHSTDECQAWRKDIEALVQSGQQGNYID